MGSQLGGEVYHTKMHVHTSTYKSISSAEISRGTKAGETCLICNLKDSKIYTRANNKEGIVQQEATKAVEKY